MVIFNRVERWFWCLSDIGKLPKNILVAARVFALPSFSLSSVIAPCQYALQAHLQILQILITIFFVTFFTFDKIRSTYEIAPKSCSARMKILTRIDNFFINYSIFSSIFSQNKILAAFCLFAKIWFSARNAHPNSKPNNRIRRPSRQGRHDLNQCETNNWPKPISSRLPLKVRSAPTLETGFFLWKR